MRNELTKNQITFTYFRQDSTFWNTIQGITSWPPNTAFIKWFVRRHQGKSCWCVMIKHDAIEWAVHSIIDVIHEISFTRSFYFSHGCHIAYVGARRSHKVTTWLCDEFDIHFWREERFKAFFQFISTLTDRTINTGWWLVINWLQAFNKISKLTKIFI